MGSNGSCLLKTTQLSYWAVPILSAEIAAFGTLSCRTVAAFLSDSLENQGCEYRAVAVEPVCAAAVRMAVCLSTFSPGFVLVFYRSLLFTCCDPCC